MTDTALLEFSYAKTGYDLAILDFSYAKTASPEEVASLDFGYAKTTADVDRWEPTITPVSFMTQVIGNLYPYWHGARRLEGGKTQRVLNSLGGYEMGLLLNSVRQHRANLHLSQADISEPDTVWAIERPVTRQNQKDNVNLLINPGFSFVFPQRLGPWGWSQGFIGATGTFSLRRGYGLFGYNAVRLTADEGEAIALEQVTEAIFRQGDQFTATIWFAGIRPVRTDEDFYMKDGPRFLVSVEYADGTVEMSQVYLRDDTDGVWTKESITITAAKETHSIRVSAIVEDRDGETVVMDFGGAQLESGTTSTEWTEHIGRQGTLFLVYPRVTVDETTAWGFISYFRQPIIAIEDTFGYGDLISTLVPTRATMELAADEDGTTFTTLGVMVDQDGYQFQVGWRIVANVIERYNSINTQNEVWATYKIGDLYGNGTTDFYYYKPDQLGVTQTLEAMTVARDLLHVVVKETWNGTTMRILKIVKPTYRWDDVGYLESIGDVYLNDGTGTCESIGLIEGQANKILVVIDGVSYVVSLLWDAAATNGKGMVMLRSDPGEAVMVG